VPSDARNPFGKVKEKARHILFTLQAKKLSMAD
jgi:hypothetical protein